MEWLRDQSDTTVHVLRRRGFTLRMLAIAERNGVVELDLATGRVAIRSAHTTSSDQHPPGRRLPQSSLTALLHSRIDTETPTWGVA